MAQSEPVETTGLIGAYYAGWADAKAGRQYGEGRSLRLLEAESAWIVPPMHRPTCPLSQKPCTSWTCLVDVCVDAKKELGFD